MTPQELKRLRAEVTTATQEQLVTPFAAVPRLGKLPELHWPEFVVRFRPYDHAKDGL